MTDKLDQSLDTIMTERRKTTRRVRNPRRVASASGAKQVSAPVGGIKKTTRPAKPAEKVAPGKAPRGDSKIIVSNLPIDVSEIQIKDYFTQTVGRVKKALLSYGPNGQSRGVATIIFDQPGAAAQAAKELDGLKVDNRPMKIEVILGAKEAPAPPTQKSLSDRIATQPKAANAGKGKAQPKPASAAKPAGAANGDKKGAGKKGAARRGGRGAGRQKPKTAEELDAEMADYWGDNGATGAAGVTAAADATASGGAVQPAGEVAMDDGIL